MVFMGTNMGVQTLTLAGERFVILPEAEYLRLAGDAAEPEMPLVNARGNYPAREAMRVILARKIIRQRRAQSLSQAELAKLAGLSAGTLRTIEQAKRSATAAEIKKIDRALAKAAATRS